MPNNTSITVCYRCNKVGHIARLCTQIKQIPNSANVNSSDIMTIEKIDWSTNLEMYYKHVKVSGHMFHALLDTECRVNLIRSDNVPLVM